MQAIRKVNESYIPRVNGESNSVFGRLPLEVAFAIFEHLKMLERISAAHVCVRWNFAVRRCAPLPVIQRLFPKESCILPLTPTASAMKTEDPLSFKHCSPNWYCMTFEETSSMALCSAGAAVFRRSDKAKLIQNDEVVYVSGREDTLLVRKKDRAERDDILFMILHPDWKKPLGFSWKELWTNKHPSLNLCRLLPLEKDKFLTVTNTGDLRIWNIDIKGFSISVLARVQLPFTVLRFAQIFLNNGLLIGLHLYMEGDEQAFIIYNTETQLTHTLKMPPLPQDQDMIFNKEGHLACLVSDDASRSFHLKLYELVCNQTKTDYSFKLKWCKSLDYGPFFRAFNNKWLHIQRHIDCIERQNIFIDVSKGIIVHSESFEVGKEVALGKNNLVKLFEDYVVEWSLATPDVMQLIYLPLGLIRTYKFSFAGHPPKGLISDIFISPKSSLIIPLFDIHCSYWSQENSTTAIWAAEKGKYLEKG